MFDYCVLANTLYSELQILHKRILRVCKLYKYAAARIANRVEFNIVVNKIY